VPAARPSTSLAAAAQKARRVCDALVRERVINAQQADAALAATRASGDRVEDHLLDHDIVQEADLLKALAAEYKVHFISSERLSKAELSRALVSMIPQRFAERVGACPVLFDAKTHALTVVTPDPDDTEAVQELQLASGAREVKPVLARPAAVRALVAKAYAGDIHAFDLLDRQAHMRMYTMPGRELDRGGADDEHARRGAETAGKPTAERAAPRAAPLDARAAAREKAQRALSPPPPPPAGPPPLPKRRGLTAPPLPVAPPPPPVPSPRTTTLQSVQAAVAAQSVPSGASSGDRPSWAGGPSSSAIAGTLGAGPSFLELLNVLVSLLENARAGLRGHSAQVARLARRMTEKLGLDLQSTAAVVCAAFVHDLGKMGQYHLTPLNTAEYDGHKAAAQKAVAFPARLLEPVHMAAGTAEAASHMYERWDGKGFPDGLAGKDIPLGARIVAICDTYADLTQNPRNPYRQALSPADALAAISKHKGTVFDPNLVDLFRNTVLGEDLRARLLANRSQALLVDADPEETTVLELRMIEQGFVVKTARTAEQALSVLAEGETDLVISELELGQGDGLVLLGQARKAPWGKDLPWVVYTRRQERALAQKALDMGVLDFVNKPANADVLVAKLKSMLDQRASARNARGVSGSLREMGLPDMVQVLFHGRKSGALRIRSPEGNGEIHFVDGNVVNAAWGALGGVDAFYAMLALADGEFALDPSFKAPTRVIHESSEALLLEGMRRLDEGVEYQD